MSACYDHMQEQHAGILTDKIKILGYFTTGNFKSQQCARNTKNLSQFPIFLKVLKIKNMIWKLEMENFTSYLSLMTK